MHFPYVADGAVPNDFAGLADEIAGMTLVAHLSGDTGLLGDPGHLTRFPDVMSQWLLTIDMLFQPHCADAHVRVQMIRSCAENRIDRFLLLQQVTKILVGRYFVVRRLRGEVATGVRAYPDSRGAPGRDRREETR